MKNYNVINGMIRNINGTLNGIFDKGYTQGYTDGFEDGKKSVENLSEKITDKDIDDAYDRGLNDAWEAAGKIFKGIDGGGFFASELIEIFGEIPLSTILERNTPQEAIAKIKEYEGKKKQDAEINVGDEVIDEFGIKAVVVRVVHYSEEDGILTWDGVQMAIASANELKKTGRTFPEIVEILKELRGVE